MSAPPLAESPEEFELVLLKSGVMSLRSLENLETFHPVTGPEVEARILHVDQQKLAERASASNRFVIWDVGLGAAANALTAIKALETVERPVEIHSFDRTTGPLEFCIQNSGHLQYPLGYEATLRELITQRRVKVTPFLQWEFHLGDFSERMTEWSLPAPHAVIYDPYSFSKNPTMWSLENFKKLFLRLDPSEPCLLTNYTRSTAVRVTLLLAGFYVGRGRAVGEKSETTIASNSLDLLEAPLDRTWLERVKVSRNAAPFSQLQGASRGDQAISAEDLIRLERSRQFQR